MAVFKYKASDGSWKTILSGGSTSSWEDITDKPTFAKVATSGDYSDLNNKPTIPNEVTESTVSGWGFATEDYVTDAIASAITTTLNTAV